MLHRLLLILLLLFTSQIQAAELSEALRKSIDSLVNSELYSAFPGASVAIGDRSGLLYTRQYGYHDYSKSLAVTDIDVFDIASCSKVFSTTFVLMRLYDQKKIRLLQTIGEILPFYHDTPISSITIEELLTHTSGLGQQTFYKILAQVPEGEKLLDRNRSEDYPYLVDKNLYMRQDISFDPTLVSLLPHEGWREVAEDLYVSPSIDTLLRNRMIEGYDETRRGKYKYVDSNFYILKLIVEEVTGKRLDELSYQLYDELGCDHSGYRPLDWTSKQHIIPTEYDYLLRRGQIHGVVHDELAALAGGVGGNSGVFSTATDLGRFCEMLLNAGRYNGQQIITESTVKLFTSSPLLRAGIYRGLGFDKRKDNEPLGGQACCGHTGFTGTIFWLNQNKGYYMVFLSNSVNPTRTNKRLSASMLRANIWEKLCEYYGDPISAK